MLADGGTAVDAALAASGVLAVVRPAWCGPAATASRCSYTPERGVVALNGSGAAPLAAAPALFPEGRVPRFGARSVAVPGLIDAWALAATDYASRPLGDLLAPAIRYARDGFPVDRRLGQAIATVAPDLAQWPALARLLAPGGHLVQPGQVLRQPELAATLATLAAEGRAAFYGGALGQTVVDALAAPWRPPGDRRPGAPHHGLAGAARHALRRPGRCTGSRWSPWAASCWRC